MIFEQFHLPGLGHASYLLGCERSGQALVFDPRPLCQPWVSHLVPDNH